MRTLATIAALCLMGCAGTTTETPRADNAQPPLSPPQMEPAPVPPPPPPIPAPQHKMVFDGVGWQLDLRGVSSWHQTDQYSQSMTLENDEDNYTRILLVQEPSDRPLFMIAAAIYQKLQDKGRAPSKPITVVSNGVSAAQMQVPMGPATVWITVFATGKHADVLGCGGLTEKMTTNQALCDQVVQGFHITE
jgi:hypothetical protein